MIENLNPMDVAKGITDYGFMAITAAFFLVICATMMIFFLKWFIKIINRFIDQLQEKQNEGVTIQKEQLELSKEQIKLLNELRETIGDETLSQVKVVTGYAFDDAKYEVLNALRKIKEENHIDNREATGKKVMIILENLHNNRNSKFDSFHYKGKRLSEYTDHSWVMKIYELILNELYSEDGYNNGRAATNIDLAYEEVKVELYKNLR